MNLINTTMTNWHDFYQISECLLYARTKFIIIFITKELSEEIKCYKASLSYHPISWCKVTTDLVCENKVQQSCHLFYTS